MRQQRLDNQLNAPSIDHSACHGIIRCKASERAAAEALHAGGTGVQLHRTNCDLDTAEGSSMGGVFPIPFHYFPQDGAASLRRVRRLRMDPHAMHNVLYELRRLCCCWPSALLLQDTLHSCAAFSNEQRIAVTSCASTLRLARIARLLARCRLH